VHADGFLREREARARPHRRDVLVGDLGHAVVVLLAAAPQRADDAGVGRCEAHRGQAGGQVGFRHRPRI
jgi:hypothetical protein